MKYSINYTKKFKKNLRLCQKRGYDMNLFEQVSNLLETTGSLPSQYHPHRLSGKYAGLWECHIQGDWLLIWSQDDTELILLFTDTGTHSDLFYIEKATSPLQEAAFLYLVFTFPG